MRACCLACSVKIQGVLLQPENNIVLARYVVLSLFLCLYDCIVFLQFQRLIMAGPTKTSSAGVEFSPCCQDSTGQACHPLLHLLRMLLVEAMRQKKIQCSGSTESYLNLLYQLDFLWGHLKGEAIEKYEFLRNRLSLVYLWKSEDFLGNDNFTRCIMNPPLHMADVFRDKRMRLLSTLRPDKLFVDASSTH
ncbi:membrane-associated protein, putative [Bodo saltans]|uniref:Membrane-associated protein, putative n=1 Tax=Bodo saltans TaxID=75058 RepID=A0A0S4KIX4_BODSA|nr:membrane-associated protein, putative [Bodo saltans]|eukprot:CUI15638.1 membrane-associated protein, putative [Bodo saltans]